MDKEIWKDIKGYEKLYQVSNLGRVKSLPKFHRTNKFYSSIGYMSKEKILKPLKQSCNYLQVDLCDVNGKRRKKYIHKLVAEAFIPNPNNYEYVNHKDEKKTNNKIDNLEWCSFDYNLNYGTRNARIKISHLKRNIEHLQQENKQLKERIEEITKINKNTYKYASEMEDKYVVPDAILKHLKQWLEEEIKDCRFYLANADCNIHKETYKKFMVKKELYQEVLDKIKELEGVKDDVE